MLTFGSTVIELQICLSILYDKLKIDGIFGQRTRIAVEQAQRQNCTVVNGECDRSTYQKIVTIRLGDKGENVKRLQRLMQKAGYSVAVDGDYGPKTKAVVIIIQQKHNLKADGIAGPKTLTAIQKNFVSKI